MGFFDLIERGGVIMYPLLVCSILIWGIFFEKLWFLSQFGKQLNNLFIRAMDLLESQKRHEAKGLCHNVPPFVGEPFLVLFEGEGVDKAILEQRVQRKLQVSLMSLKRFLWILGTIGASAPFIGLFGTVVGIIKSFASIAKTGKSGFNVVAAGLSEALIATAAGILVAVVAVIFFNYFKTRIQEISFDMKIKLEELMDKCD